jgi:methyl coenzyme M reductase subunit C-like uncharacterized protein (methanogenesis marker protein 7)
MGREINAPVVDCPTCLASRHIEHVEYIIGQIRADFADDPGVVMVLLVVKDSSPQLPAYCTRISATNRFV